MKYLRAFIAGLVLPSILIPIILCIASHLGHKEVLLIPAIHTIPIAWGIWNILYFAVGQKALPFELNTRLLITGAVLGLLIAIAGIFILHIPTALGLVTPWTYLPLIVGPILYALLWRYVVKPLNVLLGLAPG